MPGRPCATPPVPSSTRSPSTAPRLTELCRRGRCRRSSPVAGSRIASVSRAERAHGEQPAVGRGCGTSARRAATAGRRGRRRPAPTASASSPSSPIRYRFQNPLTSLIAYSVSSSLHSGCSTDSVGRAEQGAVRPAGAVVARSATRSSVPSHGICGCSHAIQASRRPSGERRGPARKCEPPTTERIADGSSAADPSSGTAAMSRVTAPSSACRSRTHQISPGRSICSSP